MTPSEARAKPSDLCMMDARPFMQGWCYRTTMPIKDILHDGFFLPVRSMLHPGDAIVVARFNAISGRNTRVLEYVYLRVIESRDDAVECVAEGDIVKVPEARTQAPQGDTGPVYSVKKDFGAGFLVEDQSGNVVERFNTKREASDYASQLNGTQEAA